MVRIRPAISSASSLVRVRNYTRAEMIHLPGYDKRLLMFDSKGQHGDLHDFLIRVVVVVDYSDFVEASASAESSFPDRPGILT